jgi:uncharacterized protein YbcI
MPSIQVARPPARRTNRDRVCEARRIARAAGGFELQLLGRVPRSVAVVSGGGCTVVTIHTELSAIERRLVATLDGQRRVLAWHRSLMVASFEALRDHLHAACGIWMRSVATHVDADTGSLLKTCTTAVGVDLVVLGGHVPGFGVAVDEHLHVDDADGTGSVCRDFFPEGFQTMKKVSHVGANEKESGECGNRSA